MPTTSVVTIEYSSNGGSTWTSLVTGLSATNNSFVWNSASLTSSLSALLRIYVDGATGTADQVDTTFARRNTPMNFYVNDTSTVGDVFTTTNSLPSYSGLTPQAPMPSIQAVLTNYDVEGRDTIFVDTGAYQLSNDVLVIWSDGGDAAGQMTIRGSTNTVAGGTVLARTSAASDNDGIEVKASYVTLRDMAIRSAYRGVYFDSNRFSVAERMLLYSNVFGLSEVRTSSTSNRNLRLWRNMSGGVFVQGALTTFVENCTFVGNSPYGIYLQGSASNVIQNNIFYLDVTNSAALADDTNSLAGALVDYNIYYFATNAVSIEGAYTDLISRQRAIAKDFRSNVTNPLMQNVDGGDFHLKSKAGRFQDSSGTFVVDTVDAWGIDKGNPQSTFTNELQVNGVRVNIGAYGNTEYASKGTTNVGIEVRIANVPATLGTNDNPLPLTWSANNTPNGAMVRVEYSGDGGLTWVALATNIPATQEYVIWSLAPIYNTYGKGLLRVVGDGGNPYGLGDTNNAPIDMFFGEFALSSESINQNMGSIVWRGAWGENYQVQFAESLMPTGRLYAWSNAVNGVGPNQQANFLSTIGGDFSYVDPQSTSRNFRIYRVIREQYEP